MPEIADTKVLIVGAGPTGLTLACSLARSGIAFRLIDAAPAPFAGSRAKGMQPRSLEAFDDFGVVDEALAAGRFHLPFRYYDGKGGYRDEDLHEGRAPTPDRPYASSLMIPQWRTEAILRDRLHALGGEPEYGSRLITFAENDDGIVATLSRDNGDETLHADWLVGCDGGHSATRHALGANFLGETIEDFRMLVGDVRASGLDRDHWHAWRNEDGFLALAPLPATDVFQLQTSIGPQTSSEPSLTLFQKIVDARTGRTDIRLSTPTWMSFWRANVRMVDRYRVGRVFLAGDAAHVHSPAGGQGMNTGIQDAYNLGWKLAAVVGGADPSLLDTYEQERLPIAAWVLGVSSRLSGSAFNASGLPARRDDETLQLGLNYRGAHLAQELRASPGEVRAGDRAPDAPELSGVDGERRLFDLFRGPHFTLLAFGEGWDDIVGQVHAGGKVELRTFKLLRAGAAPAPPALVDAGGHAWRIYGIRQDALMLVRPDGYVGFVSEERSAAALLDYLAQFARRAS
jgi:2-polyprenyl-6-methoxyphenol hydroxylase-like FAD-dependent oxidoreductase